MKFHKILISMISTTMHTMKIVMSAFKSRRETLSTKKIIFMIPHQKSWFFAQFNVSKISRKIKFSASSNVPEICVDWGNVTTMNLFKKYGSQAFKWRVWNIFWMYSRWDTTDWKWTILVLFNFSMVGNGSSPLRPQIIWK